MSNTSDMDVTPHQMERLLISRLLLEQAIRQLDTGGQHSEGFAVLSLHDCVEIVLRIIGESVEAPFKEHESFSGLINKIETKTDKTIPGRQELFRLNKARVDFKHMGMLPRSEDIRAIAINIHSFLFLSSERFLNINFSDVSIIDAVQNENIKSKLKEAEQDIQRDQYIDAIKKCAVLWHEVLSLFPRIEEERWSGILNIRPPEVDDSDLRNSLEYFTRELEEKFSTIHTDLQLLINGVDLRDYRRFKAIIPIVHRTVGGKISIVQIRDDSFYDQARARFCLKFLIDTSLLAERTSRELSNASQIDDNS
ncbi:MAG: hypothetical protein OXH16_08090 [Gemmatimonadetes bacterium]|nr:hypothetical protein [Gemmatimonadota bacterium]